REVVRPQRQVRRRLLVLLDQRLELAALLRELLLAALHDALSAAGLLALPLERVALAHDPGLVLGDLRLPGLGRAGPARLVLLAPRDVQLARVQGRLAVRLAVRELAQLRVLRTQPVAVGGEGCAVRHDARLGLRDARLRALELLLHGLEQALARGQLR